MADEPLPETGVRIRIVRVPKRRRYKVTDEPEMTVLQIIDSYLAAASTLLRDDRLLGSKHLRVVEWIDSLLDSRNRLAEEYPHDVATDAALRLRA